jgi:putative membrane protein insertion efficiency factor
VTALLSSLLAELLSVPVRLYRVLISPWLPRACRYDPSCSEYALGALRTHGPVRGLWLAARRLSRCHPWGGFGFDPVPPRQTASKMPAEAPAAASPPTSARALGGR